MFVIRLFAEGAHADLAWLLWVALGFFALMVVIGWLASRRKKPEEPETPSHPSDHH